MRMILKFILLLAIVLLAYSCQSGSPDISIRDMFPVKARFNPGEDVSVIIIIDNNTQKSQQEMIAFDLVSGIDDFPVSSLTVDIGPSATVRFEHTFSVSDVDYQGYMLKATTSHNQVYSTAIDVSSDWNTFPRYGYLTGYDYLSEDEIDQVMEIMVKHHINGLQFYDWQNTHHKPLIPDGQGLIPSSWKEISGRTVAFDTVRRLLDEAHQRNMVNYAYNLLYGAYADASSDGVSDTWGLYVDRQGRYIDHHPLPSGWQTPYLQLMNPLDPDWQTYIISQMGDVFANLPFDGWHVDQLGYRGIRYDAAGTQLDLVGGMSSLLDQADKILGVPMIFNAVDGYGQYRVLTTVEGIQPYQEVWTDDTYNDLYRIITDVHRETNGQKKMILAAYLHRGSTKPNHDFNHSSVLLLRAAVFASGGSLLSMGDQGMLDNEYFPDQHFGMTDLLKQRVRDYDDFMVAYQNLLRGRARPTALTAESSDFLLTQGALGNTVWGIQSESDEADVLHLINLIGNTNDWRDVGFSKVTPKTITDFHLTFTSQTTYTGIRLMSPDFGEGLPVELFFTQQMIAGKNSVTVTVPSLTYWDMLVFIK